MKDAQILIVDDLEDWRSFLYYWLLDEGYTCITASSVQEAQQILRTQTIELAILDIRLSEADKDDRSGLNILKWIADNCDNTKAIMLTGFGTANMVKEALSHPICIDFVKRRK